MKPLLIGCGLLAALVIIALIVLGFLVVPKISEMKNDVEQVDRRMTDLRTQHEFVVPADHRLIPERLDLVLDIRQGVAATVKEILEGAHDQGFFKAFSSVMDMMARSGQTLADGLEGAGMSPDEYLWYGDRIAAATFRGRQPEADPALRAMWTAFTRTTPSRSASVRVNRWENGVERVAIRAASVVLTDEDLQLLVSRKDAIVSSMPGILGDDSAESGMELFGSRLEPVAPDDEGTTVPALEGGTKGR